MAALAVHLGVEQPVRRSSTTGIVRVVGTWLALSAALSIVAVAALS
jgi:hypothetical protein